MDVMSDSLFLDPFAPPPSRDSAGPTGPGSDPYPDQVDTSLAAEIPLDAERAVEAFLEYVHLWWPEALRSCGEDSHVGFGDGVLLEEGLEGGRHRWADVVGIEGAALDLRWFGAARDEADAAGLDVTVEFSPESTTQTRVTVRGSGPTSFLQDWQSVLDGYARFTGGTVHASVA
jgi:hypothetical protein